MSGATMIRGGVWVLLVAGCGGSCPGAASASSPSTEGTATHAPAEESPAESAEKPEAEATAAHDAKGTDGASATSHAEASPPPVTPDPAFPEDASVSQAMAAVPAGTPRANIDQETLGEPLQSEALYAPCKVGAQHFKLRVAVWNGHAVGVDVSTPNKALSACIDKRVRELEWPAKVRSLNTVDYSM